VPDAARTPRWSALASVVPAILVRPRLWPVALRTGLGLVPSRWWTRWPPLPLPDRGWLAFRLETAYGAPDARPSAGDLLEWLAWCRVARSRERARRQWRQ
jgi:hypothetical protein